MTITYVYCGSLGKALTLRGHLEYKERKLIENNRIKKDKLESYVQQFFFNGT